MNKLAYFTSESNRHGKNPRHEGTERTFLLYLGTTFPVCICTIIRVHGKQVNRGAGQRRLRNYYRQATMDYEGQKLAELLFYWIILSFGAVGWVIGYVQQDFTVVFYAWSVGVLLSVVVSIQ